MRSAKGFPMGSLRGLEGSLLRTWSSSMSLVPGSLLKEQHSFCRRTDLSRDHSGMQGEKNEVMTKYIHHGFLAKPMVTSH